MSIVYCCFAVGHDLADEEDLGFLYDVRILDACARERPALARCFFANLYCRSYWTRRRELAAYLVAQQELLSGAARRYGSLYCYLVAIYDNPVLVVDPAAFEPRSIALIAEDLSLERFEDFARRPVRYDASEPASSRVESS